VSPAQPKAVVLNPGAGSLLERLGVAAGICSRLLVLSGRNLHRIAGARFEMVARVLRAAAVPDPWVGGVPSTKGVL
jgi:imidazoleglycerol-phosphate dehydratase